MGTVFNKNGSGGGAKIIDLGIGTSFNVSGYSGYRNFTNNNFIVEVAAGEAHGNNPTGASSPLNAYYRFNKSYNATTGVFSCSASVAASYFNVNISNNLSCHVYLVIGKIS
jgi:hypothetical protein